jgi:hypothetical protein
VKPAFPVAGAVIWIACLSASHELIAVTHLEYPNPEAVYPMPLFVRTLAPGEMYAPTLFDQKSEYAVHFDSVGTYRIRVCAKLENSAVCGNRDIVVKVK